MPCEGFKRVRLVVLGADRQQDAALAEALHIALKVHEGFAGRTALAEHKALNAVVADHAAPQRVVEIEHEAFLAATEPGGDEARDLLAVHLGGAGMNFLLGVQPKAGVVPVGETFDGAEAVERDQVDTFFDGGGAKALVDRSDNGGGRGRKAVFIIAEQTGEDRKHGLLQYLTLEAGLGLAPAGAHEVHCAFGGGCGAGGEMARVEGEEDDLGVEGVEHRGVIHQLLAVGGVVALEDIEL